MVAPDYVASTPELLAIAEQIAEQWAVLGASGHLLAHNLDTGEELGFDVDRVAPLASVVKVPIALCVLDQIACGALSGAQQLSFAPETASPGATGAAAFRHPGALAVEDLVMLMLTISDNTAADLLLELLGGVERVNTQLSEWGASGIVIRHGMRGLYDSAVGVVEGDAAAVLDLAIESERTGRHAIEVLDPDRGTVGSARALVSLLRDVWLDRIAHPTATAELRRLMGMQVYQHRLSSDLRSDSIHVSGKTGTFLHLRHEIGVVESDRGDRVAIAALTRSTRRAWVAQDIDLAIGAAARTAFEALRV